MQLPYFRLFWARKSARGAQQLQSGHHLRASPTTDVMRKPPDDMAKARACAAGCVDLAWMRECWGTPAHRGRLETLLCLGDDADLLAQHRARVRAAMGDAGREVSLRSIEIGKFPLERKFDFPHTGFRDFAVAAWETLTHRHTAQPRRGFKTADHWVEEGAGTRAQYAELEERGAPTVREAWARWEYTRGAAPGAPAWSQLSEDVRARWRHPRRRIMDSLPQLALCVERVLEAYGVFARCMDMEEYCHVLQARVLPALPGAPRAEMAHHLRAVRMSLPPRAAHTPS